VMMAIIERITIIATTEIDTLVLWSGLMPESFALSPEEVVFALVALGEGEDANGVAALGLSELGSVSFEVGMGLLKAVVDGGSESTTCVVMGVETVKVIPPEGRLKTSTSKFRRAMAALPTGTARACPKTARVVKT